MPRRPRRQRPRRASAGSPTYGVPAAAGAGDTGYDSLNRRRKKPKPYPGAPKPKQPPGPGNFIAVPPPPPLSVPPSSTANKAPIAPAMAGRVDGTARAPPPEAGRRSVRRRGRLCRQLPRQVGGRVVGRLRHQSRSVRQAQGLGVLHGVAGICGRSPTGSATPSSSTCAARLRDMARHFRR